MRKIVYSLFIIVFYLFSFAQTFYITKSGKKYHPSGCSYLKSSATSIDLQGAANEGYTPCSRCNPPTSVINKSKTETSKEKPSVDTSPKETTKKSNESTTTYKGYTIHTGPRGGQYYYNSKGNKVYIKK